MGFFSRAFCPRIYSVMNSDHARLYKLIGDLDGAARRHVLTDDDRARRQQEYLDRVDELEAEAIDYFVREEGLMGQYGYPLAEEHANEHSVLIQTIEILHLNLRNGDSDITPDAVVYLKNWLTHHIVYSDRHLEIFLAGRAEVPSQSFRLAFHDKVSALVKSAKILWHARMGASGASPGNAQPTHANEPIAH